MFGGLFSRRKSKDKLKERLKLVLSYDRAGLTPGRMEELKQELMEVIAKYFPVETEEYDLELEQQGSRMIFSANVPVSNKA